VTTPIDIKVFVTPTCPHCPRMVTLAHRMAVESPLIRAACIEASEFIDLSREYRVTGVPKTVTSGGTEILGAVAEADFVRMVVMPAEAAEEPPQT
jgi:alkyl hydroperoxide reductase subunit AhpF